MRRRWKTWCFWTHLIHLFFASFNSKRGPPCTYDAARRSTQHVDDNDVDVDDNDVDVDNVDVVNDNVIDIVIDGGGNIAL